MTLGVPTAEEDVEEYARLVSIDGEAVYELGVSNPSGRGYHSDRIPVFDRKQLKSYEEIEEEILTSAESIYDHLGRNPDMVEGDLREDLRDIPSELDAIQAWMDGDEAVNMLDYVSQHT
jgi:hypothetical protein